MCTLKSHLLYLTIIQVMLFSANCQYVQLFMLSQQIDNQCWVLDTNNLTQIGMGNCENEVYYINLGLGTPPEFFNFQIDTFRDQIWFPFNETYVNNSQTFQITNKTVVTLLNKSVYEGSVGSDIVSINQTNISTRSSIVWANKTANISLYPYINGILGLGNSPTPNFLDNAAQNNQINSSIFSLSMGSYGQPSILYYNQLPQFILDQTIYVSVIGAQLWQVQVHNVRVSGFEFENLASKRMIIDTSTSLMYFNPSLYNRIYNKYFSQYCTTNEDGKCQCSCDFDNFPPIQIILSNVQVSISSSYYLKRQGQKCVLLLGQTLNQESPILMGSSLMKDYIITFDKLNSQIGFNGKPYGAFNQIFVILQVIMITLIILALGFGVYQIIHVRFIKQEKLDKQQVKVKIERKQKKQKIGKQKLMQLSTHFLDQ